MKKVIVPLYNDPPEGLMQLEDLEKVVLSRVTVLELLENKDREYLHIALNQEEYTKSSITLDKDLKNDLVSHFLLCVANCKSDQSRSM
jgi:hypothetical protein